MTTILEQFGALVPYLLTFSFQVLRIISEKICIKMPRNSEIIYAPLNLCSSLMVL